MRCLAILLGASLVAPAAFAEDAALPPGKPAGVQKAISQETEVWILAGTAALATGVGIILFDMSNNSTTSSTATSQ